MPPKNFAPKPRLTLAQLTSYDDMCTDALVDQVYYWTEIRKNKSAYHASRGLSEDVIARILQAQVIIAKDTTQAERELLELPGLERFLQNLKTDKEKEDFRKHLKKYINIYLPDCPFEVSTTNRYTIDTHEAAVVARRDIRKGQVVKYLCGIQVTMTEEEEEDIKSTRRDFSIVVSSRNKSASLFLGPARFANHDCGANAKLMTAGNAGMEIIAVRDIGIGDEITVTYGDNYFGEDNCECLCDTCEKNGANGWAQEQDDEIREAPKPSIENGSPCKGYSLRARRRLDSETPSSRYQSETPDLNLRPQISKGTPRSLSRFKNMGTPSGTSPARELQPRDLDLKRKRQSLLKTENSIENPESDDASEPPAKRQKSVVTNPSPLKEKTSALDIIKVEDRASELAEAAPFDPSPITTPLDASRRGSVSTSAEDGNTSTDATSVDEDTIVVELPQACTCIAAIPMAKNPEIPHPGPIEQAEAGETIVIGDSTSVKHPAVDSGVVAGESSTSERSSVESDEVQKDSTGSPKTSKKRPLDEDTTSKTNEPLKKKRRGVSLPTPQPEPVRTVRIPGDYVLTLSLLSKPASAWINCKICEEPFVQEDAYFTRSSCPRCERHSKLYGYMWPKTDKEGRFDEEERILDHRTVHRFIDPHEERIVRKMNRGGSASLGLTREVSEVRVEKVRKAGRPLKADKPVRSTKSGREKKVEKSARARAPRVPKGEKPEKVWIRGPYRKKGDKAKPAVESFRKRSPAKPKLTKPVKHSPAKLVKAVERKPVDRGGELPKRAAAMVEPIVEWEISSDEEEEDSSSSEDEGDELVSEMEEEEMEIRSRRTRVITKTRRTM